MPTSDDAGRGLLLEASHGVQPLVQMPVVALDAGVPILRRPMLGVSEHSAQCHRIALGFVRRDPLWPHPQGNRI
jgi:hypothetical protein